MNTKKIFSGAWLIFFLILFKPVQADPLTILSVTVDSVSCYGLSDGKVTVSFTGGTAPYDITWKGPNFATTSDTIYTITGLAASNSFWVVVDGSGEDETESVFNIQIGQPDPIEITLDNVQDLTCHESDDGSINITVTGGNPPYTYNWTGPDGYTSISEDLHNLAPGSYSLTLTDTKGCGGSLGPVTVQEPLAISITPVSITHVSCNGAADGAIDVDVTGGTPPYTYAWTGPGAFTASTQDIAGLQPGNYSLTVTDDNGCIESYGPVTITQPDPLSITTDDVTHVSCSGGNDGAISISVTGGTTPYSYAWTGPGGFTASTQDISGLVAGNYSLSLTDANGCNTSLGPVTVTQPNPISVTTDLTADITCFGGNDGEIQVSVSGGTPPYSYAWTGPGGFTASTQDISGLLAGDYSLTVTDDNGCTQAHGPVTLNQPPELIITDVTVADVTGCYGDATGSITITAGGGTPPLEYSIDGGSNFQGSNSFTGLAAGTYQLVVRDLNGCTADGGGHEITQPAEIQILSQNYTDVTGCHGSDNGTITITADGGTPPLAYSIDGGITFSSSGEFTGLPAGSYQVVVSDNNGCTKNGNLITITQPPPMNILSETFTHVSCNGGNDGEIRIGVEGGIPPYTWSVNGGISFHSNNGIFTGLIANSYSVVVRDAAGCQVNGSTIVITEPDPIVFTVDTVKATCNHNTFDGQIEFSASGGTPPFSYSIDAGQNSQSGTVFNSLEGGTYTCVVRDQNGCEASQIVELEGKFMVTADAGEDVGICPGDEVVLNASGGDIYQWNPAEGLSSTTSSSPVASPENTTTYTVVVTRDLCYDSDEVTVTVYEVPEINAGPDTAVFIGQSYQLTATGGPFVAYAWFPSTWLDNPVIANPVTTPEETTRYYVTGTTDEGCTATDSLLIRVATRLIIPSGFTPNDDEKNNTWKILNADLYPDMVVEVFNRWGERVFYSEGYSSGREWDGTYKGKDLPIGTYYYVIRLNDGRESRAITGPVTIIR